MTLEVSREALEAMMQHAALAAPQEACGLLLGEAGQVGKAAEARNVAPEPERHFEIDPQALVDAHRAERGGGPRLLGYYHSHPNGLAGPSDTDRAQAAGDGRVWAIVARGLVGFWRDAEHGFQPLSYRLIDS